MASKKVASSHCFSKEKSWNMKFIEKGVRRHTKLKKKKKQQQQQQLVHQLGVCWFKAILGQEDSWEIMDQVAMAYKWYNLCPPTRAQR